MSILYLLTQTCDLYAPVMATNGIAGYAVAATSSSVKCRGEEDHTQVQKSNGTIIITDLLMLLDPSATVEENYKIVWKSASYCVEKVNPIPDATPTGITHYELMCTGLVE